MWLIGGGCFARSSIGETCKTTVSMFRFDVRALTPLVMGILQSPLLGTHHLSRTAACDTLILVLCESYMLTFWPSNIDIYPWKSIWFTLPSLFCRPGIVCACVVSVRSGSTPHSITSSSCAVWLRPQTAFTQFFNVALIPEAWCLGFDVTCPVRTSDRWFDCRQHQRSHGVHALKGDEGRVNLFSGARTLTAPLFGRLGRVIPK